MKICHVTSVHPRYDNRICEKECVALANKGYITYLIVNDEKDDEDYKGIHILSTGVRDTGRISRMIKAPQRVLKLAIKVDADVYQLHDPELLSISDVLLNAGKKVVFDAHEDTQKQIETKSWIPVCLRKLIGTCFGLYSGRKFKRMSGIITVTPSIVNKLKRYNSNTVMVTNYPIVREIEHDEITEVPLNPPANGYVFFAGGIIEQWCHESVAQAVTKVSGVEYYFAGKVYGDYLDRIKKVGGEAIRYLGLLSHEDVNRYYIGAIAGMAILRSDTQVGKDGTLGNTKLFEIMEAGRPVICSDLMLWREIIEKYDCGICVDSEDIDSIADAIRFVLDHPEVAKKMGTNGRRAVEKEFNWETQKRVLYSFYEKILVFAE